MKSQKENRMFFDMIEKSNLFCSLCTVSRWCSDDIEVTLLINDSSRRSFDAKKEKEEKIEVKVH